jgi:hypothetical protein
LLPVADASQTHADRTQAVAGPGDRVTREVRLYELQRL